MKNLKSTSAAIIHTELTFLVANEFTVVLVNCKSYRNELFSCALLPNQSVKSIQKADDRHRFHLVFSVLLPSL